MKGYRTVAFNGLSLLIALVAIFGVEIAPDDAEQFRGFIDTVLGGLVIVVPIVNGYLRSITTSAIFKK
jgi:hypothetical protein